MTAPCPPISDLAAGGGGGGDDVRRHLAGCVRCRALLEALPTPPAEPIGDPLAAPTLGAMSLGPLAPGRVCAVAFAALDEYLVGAVVDADDDGATIAPVGDDPHTATEWDLLLDANVLGYPATLQVWNTGDVLTEQVHEILGELDHASMVALDRLYEAVLASDSVAEGLPTGVPVLAEDDPRLLRRQEDIERARPYWQPAAMLEQVDTLGALIRSEREQAGASTAELDDIIEAPGGVQALEDDRLDLLAALPVKALARLLRTLNTGYHEGVEVLVRRTAQMTTAHAEVGHGHALARRRTGTQQPRAQPLDPETARQRADQYVAALHKEMLE